METDVRILYKALSQFAAVFWDTFQIDVTQSVTLSGLAMRLYRGKYLDDLEGGDYLPTNLPGLFSQIRLNTFIGGLTVSPGGAKRVKKAFAYDITSMFPSMIAQHSIPGGRIVWDDGMKLDSEAFGWIRVLGRAPEGKLACLLPIKPQGGDGGTAPQYIGSQRLFYGLFFTEEVKAAVDIGYQIETFGGLRFEKVEVGLGKFVRDLYKLRQVQAKAGNRVAALSLKLVINGLYGRLAMKRFTYDTVVLSDNRTGVLADDTPLIQKANKPKNRVQVDVSLPVSAAVTSYARIAMSKFFNRTRNPLLYSDTDSAVITRPLPQALFTPASEPELGKIKSEGT